MYLRVSIRLRLTSGTTRFLCMLLQLTKPSDFHNQLYLVADRRHQVLIDVDCG